jgi:dihydroorotate dehydrogenase
VSLLHDAAAAALRRIDPEDAHALTLTTLRMGLGPIDRDPPDPVLATDLAGLSLPSPIGLAAGFDKNAEVPAAILRAGFGFVECGTVTPRAQAGNPRPRLFRLTEDLAVINRLGFNNRGQEAFAAALDARPRTGVVGANIGANKDSQDRIADYVSGCERLWGGADYFTINISSPNTPGLRELQGRGALEDLLGAIGEVRRRLDAGGGTPMFLKVAPDLTDGEVAGIVETARAFGLSGLIVSNTTTVRPSTLKDPRRGETGGLSGAPLMALSTEMLRRFHSAAGGRLTLIGAGGVASGADAYAKIRAGASAVQLYTALVFQGPGLVRRMRTDLAARLRADGFACVAEAVGAP